MEYREFLEQKKHTIGEFGFDANFIPDSAWNLVQQAITNATKK